jgi:hypothetical protein
MADKMPSFGFQPRRTARFHLTFLVSVGYTQDGRSAGAYLEILMLELSTGILKFDYVF